MNFGNTGTFPDRTEYKAHDLLRLRTLALTHDMPPWLADAFATAPFAVVRRADAPPGFIAVGFRGSTRSQRYGALVERASVQWAASPEELLGQHVPSARRMLKAFAALRQVIARGGFGSLTWGPTGSVGFELATAQPVVTEASDLDLLVRSPSFLTRSSARSLRERLQTIESDVGLRIDAQLETPMGGIALNEWLEDKPRVMARSACGPRLVEDPWANAASCFEASR